MGSKTRSGASGYNNKGRFKTAFIAAERPLTKSGFTTHRRLLFIKQANATTGNHSVFTEDDNGFFFLKKQLCLLLLTQGNPIIIYRNETMQKTVL